MKIVVLIKEVPDTYGERKLDATSGRVDRGASDAVIDEIDERALEAALDFKDTSKNTEVVAMSMGPATATKALRKALAMGASSAVHVFDGTFAGADAQMTGAILSAALRREGYDLVIAGNESTDGRGGVVPAMIAERLGIPHLTFLNSVEIGDSAVSGQRSGDGCTVAVEAALPAVVSVTERMPEARFPGFKGILGAKRKPLMEVSAAELGSELPTASLTLVHAVSERPARVGGTKIFDEGDAGDKIAAFLAAGRLI
ncbi:electron transfer flavoprotein subunit beta/FixA family protein [Arthrobacter sp. CC3]|uniref:electron transfer flavoprotein subunit beta/FixA family protein n=1 Tax=Arthrobacter sp. CC3 TaxID=3029185 RepID=UPI003263F7E1